MDALRTGWDVGLLIFNTENTSDPMKAVQVLAINMKRPIRIGILMTVL